MKTTQTPATAQNKRESGSGSSFSQIFDSGSGSEKNRILPDSTPDPDPWSLTGDCRCSAKCHLWLLTQRARPHRPTSMSFSLGLLNSVVTLYVNSVSDLSFGEDCANEIYIYTSVGDGGARAATSPPKFWFGENPSKMWTNLGKIYVNLCVQTKLQGTHPEDKIYRVEWNQTLYKTQSWCYKTTVVMKRHQQKHHINKWCCIGVWYLRCLHVPQFYALCSLVF